MLRLQDTAAEARGGTYLRFNSSPGYELEPDAFDSTSKKVQLVGISCTEDENPVMSATVFVPQKQKDFFDQKIAAYADD